MKPVALAAVSTRVRGPPARRSSGTRIPLRNAAAAGAESAGSSQAAPAAHAASPAVICHTWPTPLSVPM